MSCEVLNGWFEKQFLGGREERARAGLCTSDGSVYEIQDETACYLYNNYITAVGIDDCGVLRDCSVPDEYSERVSYRAAGL